MTADDRALLDAVIAAPDDDTPRLVYAGYLEDHGRPARGHVIRLVTWLRASRGRMDIFPERAMWAETLDTVLASDAYRAEIDTRPTPGWLAWGPPTVHEVDTACIDLAGFDPSEIEPVDVPELYSLQLLKVHGGLARQFADFLDWPPVRCTPRLVVESRSSVRELVKAIAERAWGPRPWGVAITGSFPAHSICAAVEAIPGGQQFPGLTINGHVWIPERSRSGRDS